MSLFKHFFKVLSLYLEARIQIRPDPYQSDKQNPDPHPELHQSDADPQHCLKLCNKFITNITWVLIAAASSLWESHCFSQGTIRTGTGTQIRQLLLLFIIKKILPLYHTPIRQPIISIMVPLSLLPETS